MHKAGIVHEIDDENHMVRVIFPDMDNLPSGWLQVGVPFAKAGKSNTLPKKDEQVLCLMDENFDEGYVIASLYSEEDLTPLASEDIFLHKFDDGTVIQYDKEEHILTANVIGGVNITAEDVICLTAPTIQINGNQIISGNQAITGGQEIAGSLLIAGTSTAADHISAGKSGASHIHIDPQGGTTGGPQ